MLKTNSYVGCEQIEVVESGVYHIGQLVDDEAEETINNILNDGCVSMVTEEGEDVVVDFYVEKEMDDLLDTIVEIASIY